MSAVHFHVVTIFKELIEPYISGSILGRAQADGKISVSYYDPRDATDDAHRTVDDKPFGGGPGMVLKIEPIVLTIGSILKVKSPALLSGRQKSKVKIVLLAPTGKQFSQTQAREWAGEYNDIILVAGHYEGVDARVKEIFDVEEISVGSYVLSGGELPVAIIIDAVARHVPGVLGNEESLEDDRGLGIPQYTRPETYEYKGKSYQVPKVLLSGNHAEIEKWRNTQSRAVDN